MNEENHFNKNLETKCIITDFSKIRSIVEYENILLDEIKDMDIGILIINAGAAEINYFSELKNIEVEEMVNLNALQCVYLSKIFVKIFKERYDKK